MNPARKLCIVVFLSVGLVTWTESSGQKSSVQDQISEHEQKLAAARAAHRASDEGLELIILGYLYRQAGEMQKALGDLNDALSVEESAGNKAAQAMARNTMGKIYADQGLEDKALEQYNQSLMIWGSLRIRAGAAITLNYMAMAYNNLGQREEALTYLNEALANWREIDSTQQHGTRMLSTRDRLHDFSQLMALKQLNDALPPGVKESIGRNGEAGTLESLGETYSAMGEGEKAFEYFNRAMPIWRESGEQGGEALTLNNMGRTYADLGQKQNALEVFNRALVIWRAIGNRQGEAMTLNNMGRLYRDLGLQQTALDYFNQALPIWRETGTRAGEGLALNDIGRAYADMGQFKKALDYSNQALPYWRESGNLRGEAMTLNNMGRDYSELAEPARALEFDKQALILWHEVKDRRGEALALMTVGWAYWGLKQTEKAVASELAALYLAKETKDPEIEGIVETTLMFGCRDQHLPEEAIFFGYEAVNSFQQIRRNISGLDKELQAGFAQSRAATYRILAELLVEAGRLGEAEQVLDLLKEQELKDVVRGAAPEAGRGMEPLKLNAAQQKAQSDLNAQQQKVLTLEGMTLEAAELESKTTRTAAEDAQLKTLNASLQQGIAAIQDYFNNTIRAELDRLPTAGGETADSAGEGSRQSYLQETLAKLGPRVMGIRILFGEDRAYAIVVTADARKKFELKATPAELRSTTFAVLESLTAHNTDPKPLLARLYAMIVAPVDGELKTIETATAAQAGVPTLLWSLDDALRYLPIAALYDGHHYMLERFNNVLFTPESYGHMTDAALSGGARPVVLAMGLSKSFGGLPALPGVMQELEAVVHDPAVPDSHGPLDGKLLPNERFTLAAMKTELGSGNGFAVVHIASHFVVETGGGEEPYLMMGGEDSGDAKGFEWNLSAMEHSTLTFHGTRLLTLSACSTGKDYKNRNGTEMDSLGMIAQQKDAEAVLATLWDVNDASTSRLMSDFYARWLKDPAAGKAEALRQAQIALLRGVGVSPSAASQRGFEAVPEPASAAHESGNSHPFYWAPFVLIGNFK